MKWSKGGFLLSTVWAVCSLLVVTLLLQLVLTSLDYFTITINPSHAYSVALQYNYQVYAADGTLVTNLNADLLDGQHGSYYAPVANPQFTGTIKADTANITTLNAKITRHVFIASTADNATTQAQADYVSGTDAGPTFAAAVASLPTFLIYNDPSPVIELSTTGNFTVSTNVTIPKNVKFTGGKIIANVDYPFIVDDGDHTSQFPMGVIFEDVKFEAQQRDLFLISYADNFQFIRGGVNDAKHIFTLDHVGGSAQMYGFGSDLRVGSATPNGDGGIFNVITPTGGVGYSTDIASWNSAYSVGNANAAVAKFAPQGGGLPVFGANFVKPYHETSGYFAFGNLSHSGFYGGQLNGTSGSLNMTYSENLMIMPDSATNMSLGENIDTSINIGEFHIEKQVALLSANATQRLDVQTRSITGDDLPATVSIFEIGKDGSLFDAVNIHNNNFQGIAAKAAIELGSGGNINGSTINNNTFKNLDDGNNIPGSMYAIYSRTNVLVRDNTFLQQTNYSVTDNDDFLNMQDGGNIGFLKSNYGKATILAGNAAITFAHGLGWTPNGLVASPSSNVTGILQLGGFTTTQATITASANVTGDTDVYWWAFR